MNGSNEMDAHDEANDNILDMPIYLLEDVNCEQADVFEKKFGITTIRDLAFNQWFNTALELTNAGSLEPLGELKTSVLHELANDGFQNFTLQTFRSLPLTVFRHLTQKEIEILNAFGIQSVSYLSDSLFAQVARSCSTSSLILNNFITDSSPDDVFLEFLNEKELAKINVQVFQGKTIEEIKKITLDNVFLHLSQEQIDVLYERFGILTIGDLSDMDIFHTVEELNYIFELPLRELQGIAPENLAMTADEVKSLPLGVLRGLTQEQIKLLRDQFGIETLNDMATYEHFFHAFMSSLLEFLKRSSG
jgi:hypothetical protein